MAKTKALNLRVSAKTHERYKKQAKRLGVSMATVVRRKLGDK